MAATTQDYLEAAVLAMSSSGGGSAPTGALSAFAGTTIPDGWLLCNGAAVSRTTYADLFAVIGTKWGSGNGSTTFNLPNCANRFLEGTTSTSTVGTYKSAGLPNITGSFLSGSNGSSTWDSGAFSESGTTTSVSRNGPNQNHSKVNFDASKVSSLYSASSTVQVPAIYTLIIIKV